MGIKSYEQAKKYDAFNFVRELKRQEKVKEYGFSLGLQIMTGLYGDRKESLYKTARGVILIKPDTVRIYPTVVIKGTYRDELRLNGVFSPVSVEDSAEICAELMKMFSIKE